MNENASGRRRFLRSTAAGILGITGGIAATGTAAAADSEYTPGVVNVHSESNHWNYQIGMARPYPSSQGPIEKFNNAENDDELIAESSDVVGDIHEGYYDDFWFTDELTLVAASTDGWDSGLYVEVGTDKTGIYTKIESVGERFDYTFSFGGDGSYVNKTTSADDSDTLVGYDQASGYVLAGGKDGYQVYGHLEHLTIADPESGADVGFEVRFDAR